MKRMLRKASPLPVTIIPLVLAAPLSWADEHDEEPFPVGRLFFQLNDTDGDLGLHLSVDGDAWKHLEIDDYRDGRIFFVRTEGRLRRQGLTEFTFESAEPDFDTFPPERFFRRFPRGEYDIEARRLDGEEYETTVMLTRVLPAPPEELAVNGQPAPEDCDEGPVPVVSEPVTISWEEVTTSHPEIGDPGPVNIVRYEVAVEREEPTVLTLEADIHGTATQFPIPIGLLSSGDEIKYQILVQDAGGNETSSESCFEVM